MGGCYSALSRSASSDVLSFDAHDTNKPIKRPPHSQSFATTITIQGSDDHSSRLNVDVLRSPNDGADFSSRYSLGQELGRGEFGVTRLCTNNKTGEIYACKGISKRRLRTEADCAEVRREVKIMRLLAQGGEERVVRLKEAMEDSEFVYLIMELCEGGELFDRIVARGHYSERAAANVFRTIVEVVQVIDIY